MVFLFVFNFIGLITQVLTFAIFIRAILSWFPMGLDNPLVTFLFQVTEPVLAPLRRVIPAIGFMDITPLVAIIILQIVSELARAMAIGFL